MKLNSIMSFDNTSVFLDIETDKPITLQIPEIEYSSIIEGPVTIPVDRNKLNKNNSITYIFDDVVIPWNFVGVFEFDSTQDLTFYENMSLISFFNSSLIKNLDGTHDFIHYVYANGKKVHKNEIVKAGSHIIITTPCNGFAPFSKYTSECPKYCLEQITTPLPKFVSTIHLRKFRTLKYVCENLFDNNQGVTNIASFFKECHELQCIPEKLFSKLELLQDIGGVFNECLSLKTIPLNLFENNKKISDVTNLFKNCLALETFPDLFPNTILGYDTIYKNCNIGDK